MKLDYAPLLQIQRELQGLPRNYERFQQYLRTMLNRDGVELPPLGIMNPMGREHVTELLDRLLEMNADAIGAAAAAEAANTFGGIPGEFKIGLVVADDLKGGWTNRFDYEFKHRFEVPASATKPDANSPSGFRLPRWLKDFWFTGVLWSSESPSEATTREAILLPVHRFAYVHRHGQARTLREMLAQEGEVMAAAGCSGPNLEADDIEYTRFVLEPFLGAGDKATVIECMFGDAAGKTLGYPPRGLSPWAGLALALHDARSRRANKTASVASN